MCVQSGKMYVAKRTVQSKNERQTERERAKERERKYKKKQKTDELYTHNENKKEFKLNFSSLKV